MDPDDILSMTSVNTGALCAHRIPFPAIDARSFGSGFAAHEEESWVAALCFDEDVVVFHMDVNGSLVPVAHGITAFVEGCFVEEGGCPDHRTEFGGEVREEVE
jgi:hypothetical protein